MISRMDVTHELSPDRMTLVVTRRVAGYVHVMTLHKKGGAGPFTDADVSKAVSMLEAGRRMQPGQRNKTRRSETRFGVVWTHVMTGPPTWWLPRLKIEKDGTLMAGWLRGAVAVKLDRRTHAPGTVDLLP